MNCKIVFVKFIQCNNALHFAVHFFFNPIVTTKQLYAFQ
jgi:hypothetical protein